MKITAEITKEKLMHINMLNGNEILMLSLSLDNNIVDANDSIVFTLLGEDGKVKNGGTKKISEIFELFKK